MSGRVVLRAVLALVLLDVFMFQELPKEHFVIGGFIPEAPQVFLAKWRPLFVNYLSSAISKVYSRNITFELIPVDYTQSEASESLIDAGVLDFVYNHPVKLVCLEASRHFVVIATQRTLLLGKEAGGYGGAIFSLESNHEIRELQDIRNKRVGIGSILASGGFALPYKLLKEEYGIDIFTDIKQIVFYQADNPRCVTDLLSGRIDVAFTQSGFIEATRPEALPLLRTLHELNATFQGEPYPFKTSTDIIPTYSLMASPNIPWHLRQSVTMALSAINGSQPAAMSAQISHFTIAASYEIPRATCIRLGILRDLGTSFGCMSEFSGTYDFLHCPDGYLKSSREDVANGCARANVSCPTGLECVCRPCAVDDDLSIFVLRTLANDTEGKLALCVKTEQCIAVEQNQPFQLLVRNLRSRNLSLVARISSPTAIPCGPSIYPSMCLANITIAEAGLILVEVLGDGIVPGTSSVLVRVNEAVCDGNVSEAVGFMRREASPLGECVCPPSSFDVSNRCVSSAMVLTVAIVPVGLLLATLLLLYGRHRIEKQDSAWKIQSSELIFDDPPEVLGRGTFGLVLRATFRNTPVAVKKVIPPMKRSSSISNSNSSGSVHPELEGGRAPRYEGSRKASTTSSSPSLHEKWDRSSRLRARLKHDFLKEIRLLAHLRHPNIIPLMGAAMDKDEPLLVMELMNLGSLWDLLRNETMEMEGSMALQILLGVVHGMSFLHASNPAIVHGDLKSSNVLVNDKFQARISDFGLSQKRRLAKCAVGTPFWTAPECLKGAVVEPSSDVYSFAITIWEVMSRREPYEGEDEREVLQGVREGLKRPVVPEGCGAKMESVMVDCWNQEARLRPTFDEVAKRIQSISASEVCSVAWVRIKGFGSSSSSQATVVSWERCFPPETAHAVDAGHKVPPIRKQMVSVFFSDVVGFTTISSAMDPVKVSDMLDRLYVRFDAIAESMKIFKIETIGDAYICATNLCEDQEHCHAAVLARFAMAAVQAATETLIDPEAPERGHVVIRVGLCSGPVTGCLIGTKNVKFTLLGDTVNVASRMESTSFAGYIQCAEATANLISTQDPSVNLIYRGSVEVKGKGKMITYWIGKAPPASCPPLAPPTATPPINRPRRPSGLAASLLYSGGSPKYDGQRRPSGLAASLGFTASRSSSDESAKWEGQRRPSSAAVAGGGEGGHGSPSLANLRFV